MGLLDYGPMLKGKPKLLPPELDAPRQTDLIDAFGDKAHIAEIRSRGGNILDAADIPLAGGKGPERALETATGDMDFGIGDKGFPGGASPRTATGKIDRPLLTAENYGSLSPGEPNLPKTMPEPGGGLLASKLPATAPVPPSRPAGLGETQVAGTPMPRPVASLSEAPRWRREPPLPPPRPAGLGMDASGGATAAAPSPRTGLLAQAPTPPVVSAPPPAPPPPPPAPIAPPPPATAPPAAGGVGGAGGGPSLGGIAGALGGIAKAFSGGGAPPPPQVRFPQLSPSNAGPTVDAQIVAARGPAQQIMTGLLADDVKTLVNPKKRPGGLLA
jgi:hypothetical protein